MAYVFNVTNLIKGPITTDNSQIHKENVQSFIISIPQENLHSSDGVSIIVQQTPKIVCTINFTLGNHYYVNYGSSQRLKINIKSTENESNQQFVANFHMINFEDEISDLSTTTNLSNFSTTFFERFDNQNNQMIKEFLFDSSRLNGNLYMYCSIEIKSDSSAKSAIPEKKLPTKFLALYEDKLMTDFSISCKDQEFLVHKAILGFQSSVFRAMFEIPMKESQENQVKISDFEPKIVELMIRYIYSDEIEPDLSVECLKQLILISNKYDIQSLKMLCLEEICKQINSISEAMDFMLFAGAYDLNEFKERMVQFIKENRLILL